VIKYIGFDNKKTFALITKKNISGHKMHGEKLSWFKKSQRTLHYI